jgi:hypothetical protein
MLKKVEAAMDNELVDNWIVNCGDGRSKMEGVVGTNEYLRGIDVLLNPSMPLNYLTTTTYYVYQADTPARRCPFNDLNINILSSSGKTIWISTQLPVTPCVFCEISRQREHVPPLTQPDLCKRIHFRHPGPCMRQLAQSVLESPQMSWVGKVNPLTFLIPPD